MMVLPGTGKTFDQFRLDEQDCRAHAQSQITKSGAEQESAGSPQQRYDRSFLQCMYAKGHKVPLTGRVTDYIDSTQVDDAPLGSGIDAGAQLAAAATGGTTARGSSARLSPDEMKKAAALGALLLAACATPAPTRPGDSGASRNRQDVRPVPRG